jgi:hypothetical protein
MPWPRAGASILVFVLVLLPALAGAQTTVLLSGATLQRRNLPEFITLPDSTTLRLGELRIRCLDPRSDETLVYDVQAKRLERNRAQTPSQVLRRKRIGLAFLSVRDPKQGSFYAPAVSDLEDGTLDEPDLLVVATGRPFLSRPRVVPEPSAAWPALLSLAWLAARRERRRCAGGLTGSGSRG